jgi:hypothetical protein
MYGTGTRSYNRSTEKRQMDKERKAVTAAYVPKEFTFGPICNCRSFNFPHELGRHRELKSDFDWRTESERRSVEYWHH